jgi:hypothetical protein
MLDALPLPRRSGEWWFVLSLSKGEPEWGSKCIIFAIT